VSSGTLNLAQLTINLFCHLAPGVPVIRLCLTVHNVVCVAYTCVCRILYTQRRLQCFTVWPEAGAYRCTAPWDVNQTSSARLVPQQSQRLQGQQ